MLKEEFQEDPAQFKQYLRMTEDSFNKLLNWIKPFIEKKDTNYREAISAKAKLIITLRFLVTGETYRSLMYTFRVHESTISLFVPEVCKEIYSLLKDEYLKVHNFKCYNYQLMFNVLLNSFRHLKLQLTG